MPGRLRVPRSERGASAVEFAMVLPILVMLLFGITTSGLSYSQSIGVANAVREGARLGATSDACGATPPAGCTATAGSAWADAVIQRVRQTQFDDPTTTTKICVQLWKVGTGAVANTAKCSPTSGGPAISVPTTATDAPAVPSSATGACFVRVIAARPFTINIGITQWDKLYVSRSAARYERKDKLPDCL